MANGLQFSLSLLHVILDYFLEAQILSTSQSLLMFNSLFFQFSRNIWVFVSFLLSFNFNLSFAKTA